MQSLRSIRAALLAACALLLNPVAYAQVFPTPGKPIRVVVPFPPGGQTDIQARALSVKLSNSLGVPVVVDNKPGASTILGAMDVVKSLPDGHTLLYTISVTASQNPHLFSKLPYDPFKDLTPMMLAARSSVVLTVPVNSPYNTLKDLVDFAKRNPGKLNFGSFSAGSTSHLAGELLKQQANIDIVHIPYKGSADAGLALLGGHIQMLFDGPTTAIANAKAGKVKLLGYVDEKRLSVLPDVPTMAEAGVAGVDLAGGMQFFGPAGMPPTLVTKVNTALAAALRQPDIVKLYEENGTEITASSPQEHARLLREWYEKWGAIIRKLGLKLD